MRIGAPSTGLALVVERNPREAASRRFFQDHVRLGGLLPPISEGFASGLGARAIEHKLVLQQHQLCGKYRF